MKVRGASIREISLVAISAGIAADCYGSRVINSRDRTGCDKVLFGSRRTSFYLGRVDLYTQSARGFLAEAGRRIGSYKFIPGKHVWPCKTLQMPSSGSWNIPHHFLCIQASPHMREAWPPRPRKLCLQRQLPSGAGGVETECACEYQY